MEKLDLEKFNPQKAELQKIVSEFKDLTIKGVDDKEGYLAVDEARKHLKAVRVKITKTGKELRAEALSFQKAVIAKEKELVEIIEPTEIMLAEQQDTIDKEKERIARAELLPMRKEKLATIGITEMPEDDILAMDYNQFDDFFNSEREAYLTKRENDIKEAEEKRQAELAEQERKNKEEADRLEREKREAEIRKQAEDEAREKAKQDLELAQAKADQEAQERARIAKEEADKAIQAEKDKAEQERLKAEEDKQKAIQEEKDKAEAERKRLIEEQEAKEKARIEEEKRLAQEKADADERAKRLVEEEKSRVEKLTKYKQFLSKNGYTDETADQFKIIRTGDTFTIYKKLDEIVIK